MSTYLGKDFPKPSLALVRSADFGNVTLLPRAYDFRSSEIPVTTTRRIVRPGGARMYEGAQSSRLTADLTVSITSANAEIFVSAIALRSRLRKLERDDDYFRQMLWLLENNVIGEGGIRLRMKARDDDGKLDRQANALIEAAWEDYLSEPNCAVTRNRSGVELQRLAMRALARDGVILFRRHRGFDNPYGYAVEVIEADRLDHWWNRPAVSTANEIQFGVEMDRFAAPLAYWILTRHPGDIFAWRGGPKYRERIPADEIIPLWVIERAGQNIGTPLWPSIVTRLNQLHRYEQAEETAATLGAMRMGVIEKEHPTDYAGPVSESGQAQKDMEPGLIYDALQPGETYKDVPVSHPSDVFAPFLKQGLRGAAAGAHLPYASVASDLSEINYSSFKAGMNEARDGFKYLQRLVMQKLMRPWFRDWLFYAMLKGKIPLPMTKFEKFVTADRWKPRRWAGLEPLKETQSAVLAIQNGLDSRRNIIEEDFDRDIEDVFDEQEHDAELAKEHGLIFAAPAPVKPEDDAKQPEAA